MEIIKPIFFVFMLITVALAGEGVIADAIRNIGITGIGADVLSGSAITFVIVRMAKV